jgi:hypothetical protein
MTLKLRAPLKTQWEGSLKEGVAKITCNSLIKLLPSGKKIKLGTSF